MTNAKVGGADQCRWAIGLYASVTCPKHSAVQRGVPGVKRVMIAE